MPGKVPVLPETISLIPVVMLVLASVLFILAAAVNGATHRDRLVSAGLACWVLYVLMNLVGGMVR